MVTASLMAMCPTPLHLYQHGWPRRVCDSSMMSSATSSHACSHSMHLVRVRLRVRLTLTLTLTLALALTLTLTLTLTLALALTLTLSLTLTLFDDLLRWAGQLQPSHWPQPEPATLTLTNPN